MQCNYWYFVKHYFVRETAVLNPLENHRQLYCIFFFWGGRDNILIKGENPTFLYSIGP